MDKSELKRLSKIEKRIYEIVCEEMGLSCLPIEFDVIPPQKMLEIMAYHIPTNISNWKRGRDYERERTIYEHSAGGLPYEVVINSNPARAYLMSNNKFAVQCLVMAHVYGHVAFFSGNSYFIKSRQDIINLMYEASHRFMEYERRYGIDEVEKTVDAGHALQFHSSPFASNETEDEKRERIFEQTKKNIHVKGGAYEDLGWSNKPEINEDIELFNQKLWRGLKSKTPVEPTGDLLRYLIDNSLVLEDWQRDILEVLRIEGQYYWPIIKTKFMNEGFATMIHQKVVNQLVKEKLMTLSEHAEYNYANSLVKADPILTLNPYTIGCGVWKDIEDRWNKGRFGQDWEDCDTVKAKHDWDTKSLKGFSKCIDVMRTYVDWFFIQEFLTLDLVKDLGIYLYAVRDAGSKIEAVITKETAKEIKDQLVNAFAQSSMPTIEIVDGNHGNMGRLLMEHRWDGLDLDESYAKETMKHIVYLWGNRVILNTQEGRDAKLTWALDAEEWIVEKDGETTDKPAQMSLWEKYLGPYRKSSPLDIGYACPI